MTARLKDGFEVKLNEEVLNDWEFLEVLADIDEGEGGLIVKAARMLLGKDGVKMLKEHIKDENGKVPADVMANALLELMNSVGETKN